MSQQSQQVAEVETTGTNQVQVGAIQAGATLKQQGKNVAELVLFDEQLFNRVTKWGEMMAGSKSMIPKHLQGNASDCSAVIMQALRWGIDPYACAQKTHLVSGTLGYEAQLVNAIIQSNAPVEGRPKYEKIGDWSKILGKFKEVTGGNGNKYHKPDWSLEDEKGLGVRLELKLKGQELQPFELMLSQATVRNSTLWASDPYQQLCYLAIKRWARLYCPDVIMGVYTPDELESGEHIGPDNAKDVTPPSSKAASFAASSKPDEATVTDVEQEEPEATTAPAKEEAEEKPQNEVVYVKTPPGSKPEKGALPFNSLEEAATKMIKAIETRYQNEKHDEIKWLIDNNKEVIARIQNEYPDLYTVINDFSK